MVCGACAAGNEPKGLTMSTTKNAIKALEKAGANISIVGNKIMGKIGNQVVEFRDQDGLVIVLRVYNASDRDNSLEDYAAGSWMKSVARAIRCAERLSVSSVPA
jgi:hypothetical protein